jgi:hypothetical protein
MTNLTPQQAFQFLIQAYVNRLVGALTPPFPTIPWAMVSGQLKLSKDFQSVLSDLTVLGSSGQGGDNDTQVSCQYQVNGTTFTATMTKFECAALGGTPT